MRPSYVELEHTVERLTRERDSEMAARDFANCCCADAPCDGCCNEKETGTCRVCLRAERDALAARLEAAEADRDAAMQGREADLRIYQGDEDRLREAEALLNADDIGAKEWWQRRAAFLGRKGAGHG